MPNHLTGSYDAVLQIRARAINAILATLHQDGAQEDASPVLQHGVTMRVGDPPPFDHPDFGVLAEWVNTMALSNGNDEGSSGGQPSDVGSTAPPGAAHSLNQAFLDLQGSKTDVVSPGTVRGLARVQLSSASVSLPPGSTAEVTIKVHVRAQYKPDAGTLALPEPIAGMVQATYTVRPKTLPHYGSGQRILEIALSQDDQKIQFTPDTGSGLSPFEASQLVAQVRKVLREGFEPVNAEIPADFPFVHFKELGAGQVVAVPVGLTAPFQVSGNGLPSITHSFVNDDFAVAIAQEYFNTLLGTVIDALKASAGSFSVSLAGILEASYDVKVNLAPPVWTQGKIEISGSVKLTTGAWWAPNGSISFKLGVGLGFNQTTQHVRLQAAGQPSVDESWWIPHSTAVSAVRRARDEALAHGDPVINAELDGARDRINDALANFANVATARFRSVEITPHGLVLNGGITTRPRSPAVVAFEEARDGVSFTALESWIPGGRIDRFEWSWIQYSGPQGAVSPWGGETVVVSDRHRFVFPKPAGVHGAESVCLRIEGVQLDRHGNETPIAVGETCSVSTPEVAWKMPASWDSMMVPVWLPDTPADAVLDDAIAAHVNVLVHSRPGDALTSNSIVHFTDLETDRRPLDVLGQALGRLGRSQAPPVVIGVLPTGAFGKRRRELEAALGSLGETFKGRLLLTEDYTGGWKRTFAPAYVPSTYIINAHGEFVWKHESALDGSALAAALDRYLIPGRAAGARQVTLAFRPGDRIPQAVFTDDTGHRVALRKLRGQQVLLVFWRAWSGPSLRELQRLQALHDQEGARAPVILAVNGGDPKEAVAEVRRSSRLTFALAHDEKGLVARQLGVECWPTTISVDPTGVVNSVLLGTRRHHHGYKPPAGDGVPAQSGR
jgi:peroxiredoxin